jgi:hypothetical protein
VAWIEADPAKVGEDGVRRGCHPNSLANLRPPWRPGQSGNPRGTNNARRERDAQQIALGILDAIDAAYERGDEEQADALLEPFAQGRFGPSRQTSGVRVMLSGPTNWRFI